MESIESFGKNVQEAIESGLSQLGAKLDEVKVEILSEGGMFKKAKVKLTKTESFAELFDATSKPQSAEPCSQESGAETNCLQTNCGETEEARVQNESGTTYALSVLNKILKLYNPNVYATERVQNKVVVFEIQGEGCEVFGNTDAVNALQTILNTIERGHNKEVSLKRIIVNVGDYEKKREADLCEQAIKCADEAISSGKTIRMQPMNSFERHLIHDFLANRKDVIAESFGVEPYRYITVRPNDKND